MNDKGRQSFKVPSSFCDMDLYSLSSWGIDVGLSLRTKAQVMDDLCLAVLGDMKLPSGAGVKQCSLICEAWKRTD